MEIAALIDSHHAAELSCISEELLASGNTQTHSATLKVLPNGLSCPVSIEFALQVSMDTACSSALVAVHNGMKYVRSDGAPAVAAAVNLMLAETTTAAAFAAGMLNQNGRCKTMDAVADGYVRWESMPQCDSSAEWARYELNKFADVVQELADGLLLHVLVFECSFRLLDEGQFCTGSLRLLLRELFSSLGKVWNDCFKICMLWLWWKDFCMAVGQRHALQYT